MGSKSKKRVRQRERPAVVPSGEDRRSEAVTVAWMLSLMATLLAELVAAAAFAMVNTGDTTEFPDTLRILPGLMLFSAAVTGLMCLALTFFTYRFRRTPPPAAITAVAVCASLAPLVALAWLLLS